MWGDNRDRRGDVPRREQGNLKFALNFSPNFPGASWYTCHALATQPSVKPSHTGAHAGSTTGVRRLGGLVAPGAMPVRWPGAGDPVLRYAFGDCVLDTERYVLQRAGQPIRLRPKVFQVLVYLLSHRERVVTKQELGEQVWQGQFISDATLESTLAAVRRALGDRGRAHRYIQTLHGHGYRFVAPVEERAEPPPRAAGETSPAVAEAPAASQLDDLQITAVLATLPSVGEHAPGSPLEEEAGAPLASQETPPSDREPSPGAGERKLVSVLCCALSLVPGPSGPEDLDTLHQQVCVLYNLSQRGGPTVWRNRPAGSGRAGAGPVRPPNGAGGPRPAGGVGGLGAPARAARGARHGRSNAYAVATRPRKCTHGSGGGGWPGCR
jgi:DNA-binding winged helix-turn-helix (wHTH) protein